MLTFKEGNHYSRAHIAKQLGGDTQSYLPHKNGRVVCGCFRTDFNPNAPSEVLTGNGPEIKRWGDVFSSQSEAVPVFLRRGSTQWEFVGLWRCVGKSEEIKDIKMWELKTGRSDISMILQLQKLEQ